MTHSQAAVLALSEVRGVGSPHQLAQILEEAGGPEPLLTGEGAAHLTAPDVAEAYATRVDHTRVGHWEAELSRLAEDDIRVVTVCDADYPVNLRLIFNRPPFLFVWGDLRDQDQRAVAVVGTRDASAAGQRLASELATGLTEHGVTVISGLALGIDVAAHTAALNARGRTIAVLGHGITRVYPAAHRALARQIRTSGHGALVSQFLPSEQPRRWTFPQRNVVTSGLSVGTIVVEAGESSGARIQADQCLEHGKRLFLVDELVTHQPWARELADHPGVSVVSSVDTILSEVARDLAVPADISVS